MTEIEIRKLREKISRLFVEYGRIKGFLEIKGTRIDTPQAVFLDKTKTPKDSLIYEIDGLNQVWSTTEALRDKVEDVIDHHENIDFNEIDKIIDSWLVQAYVALSDIERSIVVKTKM